jgi:hypothetical protein
MASVRSHTYLARSADEVWKVVSDPVGLVAWFPNVVNVTLDGPVRTVEVTGGIQVQEEIVTNNGELRRFQYRLLPGPVPIEGHLATVDVLESGEGSIVVYGVDVSPDALGQPMQDTVAGAVQGLKQHLEAG